MSFLWPTQLVDVLIVGVLVALSLLCPPWSGTRWHPVIDTGLALGTALFTGIVGSIWHVRYYIAGNPWIFGDFTQYCDVVAAIQAGGVNIFAAQRSHFVGTGLAFLSRYLGIIDGMAAGAAISLALVGVGTYCWAFAVAGRRTAVLSVLAILLVPAVVLQSRTLSFYPPFCAILALSTGLSALSLAFCTPLSQFLAGAAIGTALLVDLKALPWVSLLFVTVAFAGVVAPASRGYLRLLRPICFLLPIALSWQVAPRFWFSHQAGLESQVASYTVDIFRRANEPVGSPADLLRQHCDISQGSKRFFVWGSSELTNLPATFQCLARLQSHLPPPGNNEKIMISRYFTPMIPVVVTWGTGSILALVGPLLQARRWQPAVIWIITLPTFLFTFLQGEQEVSPRRLGPALLFLPVAIGMTLSPNVNTRFSRYRWASWFVPILFGLLIFGVIPSFFSPTRMVYRWYESLSMENALHESLANRTGELCRARIQQDHMEGHPTESRFLQWYEATR